MKKIAVLKSTGSVLDWLVAKAQGDTPVFRPHVNSKGATIYRSLGLQHAGIDFRPSTNWEQGGPIIEREGIYLWRPYGVGGAWSSKLDDWPNERVVHAETPLVAAMRCYVVSKLGDEIDIPNDLV